mmetsp:Transcript_10252/g.23123  ORF Transcript_10252/g.23123 Transcript_10252/m.23123 type:complete len:500 (+) Transcript_10252:73-1572(+)
MAASQLPQEVAENLLRRYADVLRVGHLRVGEDVIHWETDCTNEMQMQNFCSSFHSKLQALLPDMAAKAPDVLMLTPFWLCKAVSINYALVEVLLMIKQRVGVMCTIETRDPGGGALVEYGVDVLPENVLQVSLEWRSADNLIHRDPNTAEKKVKGTLSRLVTEFSLPPEEGYAPAYGLELRLRRSLASKFAMRMACGSDRRVHVAEAVFVDEPLRAEEWPSPTSSKDGFTSLARHSINQPGVGIACAQDVPLPPTVTIQDPALLRGPAVLVRDESLLGRLQVKIVGANGLQVARGAGEGHDMYVLCSLGGRVKRTKAVSPSSSPKWLQSWGFPVRSCDLRSEVLVEVFGEGQAEGQGLDLLGRVTVPVARTLGRSGVSAITETLDALLGSTVDLELELLPEESDPASESAEDGDASERGVSEDFDDGDCVVEVGTSFTTIRGRSFSRISSFGAPSAASFTTVRSDSFAAGGVSGMIRVRAAEPGSNSSAAWCTRPCVSK